MLSLLLADTLHWALAGRDGTGSSHSKLGGEERDALSKRTESAEKELKMKLALVLSSHNLKITDRALAWNRKQQGKSWNGTEFKDASLQGVGSIGSKKQKRQNCFPFHTFTPTCLTDQFTSLGQTETHPFIQSTYPPTPY